MHDQPRIALFPGHVIAVVVDAVAVEDQRRITEQQHRVRVDRPLPDRVRRWVRGWRNGRLPACAFGGRPAVNDVVFLDDGRAFGAGNLVAHQHEDQRPALAFLGADVEHFRAPPDLVADPKGSGESDAPARPHAPRQRHRRQEIAPFGVAVDVKIGMEGAGQEIEPVPTRRHRIAGNRFGVVPIQRRRETRQGRRRDHVRGVLGAPNPLPEVVEVEGHAWNSSLQSKPLAPI